MERFMASVTTTPDRAPGAPPLDPRRWRALGVLALVQIMLVLDITVVNVALPSMESDLGFSQAGLAWVVNGYALTFGGLLLLGGRMADYYGRRRLFLLGIVLFTAASAAAGFATSPAMMVTSRFAQGVAAALIAPAALSLVTLLFTDTRERTRALSIWGGLAGLGGTFGVLISGVLSDLADWRWVFFINLPVGAVALALAPRLLRESKAEERGRLDVVGAVLVTAGLSLIVYALLDKGTDAWTSATVLGRLGAGVALIAAFLVVESRIAHPLVPLRIFRSRTRSTANLVAILFGAALIAMFFTLTLYMQGVLGYSPLRTGVAYLPFGASLLASIALTSQLVPRIGVRPVMTGGLAFGVLGLWLFSQIEPTSSYLTDVLPAMLVFSFGAGATFVTSTIAAVDGVGGEDAGLASGLLNAGQQVGGAVGLAALVSLAISRTADELASGTDPASAATNGFAYTFAVGAVVLAIGAVVALVGLGRVRPPSRPDEEPVSERELALAGAEA
jgi:EmrB/QacA subfamily drug resistance transporter